MCVHKVKNKRLILIITALRCREVEFCDAFDEITKNICETSLDNGLKQIITKNTRVKENARTLIDFVITSNINVSAKNNGANKIADHEI